MRALTIDTGCIVRDKEGRYLLCPMYDCSCSAMCAWFNECKDNEGIAQYYCKDHLIGREK